MASAIAAASVAASAPPTRVVLRVATSGKPSGPTGASAASSVSTATVTTRVSTSGASSPASGPAVSSQSSADDPDHAADAGEHAPVDLPRQVVAQPIDGALDRVGQAHGRQTYSRRPAAGAWRVPLPSRLGVNWLTDQSISGQREAQAWISR